MSFSKVRGRYLTSRRIRERERLQEPQQQQQQQQGQQDQQDQQQQQQRQPPSPLTPLSSHIRQQQQKKEKKKGENSRLKSWLPDVGRWLKPKSTPTEEDEGEEDHESEPSERCFIPNPKITFLVDQKHDLICQICQLTPLEFLSEADPDVFEVVAVPNPGAGSRANLLPRKQWSDCVPAVMPCGHVAGSRCLKTWLASNVDAHCSCPFCRVKLLYRQCGHRVPLRHVTRESVHLLPATVPEGGCVPDLCTSCHETELRAAAEVRFQACKRRLLAARERLRDSWSLSGPEKERQASALVEHETEFERCMVDEFYLKAVGAWLTHW